MSKKFELDRLTQDSWLLFQVLGEFALGFERMSRIHQPAVTVFGSARTSLRSRYYTMAHGLGSCLARHGFAVVTGGGPGAMEAANRGAFEAGGVSVGMNIHLETEQEPNKYLTLFFEFEHFYARKVMLAKYSSAFVVFPGGFGTLDELFEILTLTQTQKVHPMPIFLVGKRYWDGLVAWIRDTLAEEGAISTDDVSLFKVVDDIEAIPPEILRYHDASISDRAGFKIPTEEDRKRAQGA